MPYDPRIMGQVIRSLRKKRRISQEVLSGFAGIARSHLAMIERGKNAQMETLWRIAEALDMPLSDILRMAEDEIAKNQPDSVR